MGLALEASREEIDEKMTDAASITEQAHPENRNLNAMEFRGNRNKG